MCLFLVKRKWFCYDNIFLLLIYRSYLNANFVAIYFRKVYDFVYDLSTVFIALASCWYVSQWGKFCTKTWITQEPYMRILTTNAEVLCAKY